MRAILAELGIDLKRRGETLSVAEFVEISNQAALLRGGGEFFVRESSKIAP